MQNKVDLKQLKLVKCFKFSDNTYLYEGGSGHLVIKADDLYIQNAAGSQTNIKSALSYFRNNIKELDFSNHSVSEQEGKLTIRLKIPYLSST